MVGIRLSYWGGLFSGATLVSGRVVFLQKFAMNVPSSWRWLKLDRGFFQPLPSRVKVVHLPLFGGSRRQHGAGRPLDIDAKIRLIRYNFFHDWYMCKYIYIYLRKAEVGSWCKIMIQLLFTYDTQYKSMTGREQQWREQSVKTTRESPFFELENEIKRFNSTKKDVSGMFV